MPIRRSRGGGRPLPSVAVIDVRLLRTDLDGVKKNLARAAASTSARSTRPPRSTPGSASSRANATTPGGRSTSCRSRWAGCAATARSTRPRPSSAESRALGDTRAAARRRGQRRRRASCATCSCAFPTSLSDEAPDGASEADNPVVRVVGYDAGAYGEHQRVPHWEIGTQLGILDNERAVKISGAMFTMQRGLGATLVRALCQLALDRNADAFEEIRPPIARHDGHPHGDRPAAQVRRRRLRHRARRPVVHPDRRGAADLDRQRRDASTRRDLPVRIMADTPCYRREAGSAGRDTRGLLRVHEFDKVEVLAYATAEQAPALLVELLEPGRGARSPRSASPTGWSTSAPATSARAITAASTSRSTRRAATSGSRSARCRGSATTRPAGPTCATGPGAEGHRARPHAQRLGPRHAPGVGRHRRDQPPAGRLDRPPRGALAVPARPQGDPGAMTEERVAAILKVRDMEASLAWYGQVGFKVRGRFPDDEPTWAEVGRDGSGAAPPRRRDALGRRAALHRLLLRPPGERRRGAGGHERQGRAGVGPGGARVGSARLGYVDPDGYIFTFTESL